MSAQDLLSRIGADGRRALNSLRVEGGEPLVEPTLEILLAMIRRVTELEMSAANAAQPPEEAVSEENHGK